MIALVFSMVRARPAQALVAFLLATFAVAASVSGPVYLAAGDRAVVASEVNAAPAGERTVQIRHSAKPGDRSFERYVTEVFTVPGFTSVFSTRFDGWLETPDDVIVPRTVYRDDVCAHVRLVAGRCFAGTGEIILPPDGAETLGIGVGGTVEVCEAEFVAVAGEWAPSGGDRGDWGPRGSDRVALTVVGIYEVIDPGEPYWSRTAYFEPSSTKRLVTAPAFTNRPTIELVQPDQQQQALDVLVGADAITAESLRRVDAAVRQAVSESKRLGADTVVNSDLPKLLTRADRNRALVAEIVPVASAPLLGLCWLVLFVAVVAGTQERRHELGLLALRGARTPHRWWLAAGEAILPILLGSLAGYFLGYLIVRLAAVLLFDRTGSVPIGAGATHWALAAVVGALLAGLLAQRRELAQPTVDLLRNVPSRLGRWRSMVMETLVVLLAVAAVWQLRTGGGGLRGVAALAPALVVLAIGLAAARSVGPVADRAGARALQRGRIGPMLAAYALSRRPGSQRILALLVVAVALLCFAATAAGVAGEARVERVRAELGATRVVGVDGLSRRALLAKTRAADPEGRWAMAVSTLPEAPGMPRTIAVDAARLAAVAEWRGGTSAATVAGELHPDGVRESVTLSQKDFQFDVTLSSMREGYRVALLVIVQAFDGSATDRVNAGAIQPGRHTYTRSSAACVKGCRLVGIELRQPEERGFAADLTLHELRQDGKVILDAAQLAQAGTWRAPLSPGAKLLVPDVGPTDGGLRVRLDEYTGASVAFQALYADWPSPMPVAVTPGTALAEQLPGVDEASLPVEAARSVAAVPRFGRTGVLVDLDYVDRAAIGAEQATDPEVWLGPAAPPDALDRLRAQGLTLTTDRSLSAILAALEDQGPAVALRFHELAAGFAVVLAGGALWFVAGVDRRRRTGELRSLRTQGVSRRDASASGYIAIAATAIAIGPFAALVSWLLVGDRVPVFADQVTTIDIPRWPPPLVFGAAWLGAAAALGATALLASWRLRRRAS